MYFLVYHLVGFHWVPESPKWLLQHGNRTEAEDMLTTLRPKGYPVEEEVCVLDKVICCIYTTQLYDVYVCVDVMYM